jgi:hypothetical protein
MPLVIDRDLSPFFEVEARKLSILFYELIIMVWENKSSFTVLLT